MTSRSKASLAGEASRELETGDAVSADAVLPLHYTMIPPPGAKPNAAMGTATLAMSMHAPTLDHARAQVLTACWHRGPEA